MGTENKIIIVLAVIIVLIAVIVINGRETEQPGEITGKLSANDVKSSSNDVGAVPPVGYDECMHKIRQVNPEMSVSDAKNSCIAIEAVKKNDPSMCQEINDSEIKQDCLGQF